MTFRILLFVAAFPLIWSQMRGMEIPHDGESLKECLKELGRRPGPMGYFNPIYMAFTLEQAEQFPDLVSTHSKMRRIKSSNVTSNETLKLSTDTVDYTNTLNSRVKRDDPTYPQTILTGMCEKKIGGLDRLCEVCSAHTDLGPDKSPRFINEVVCGSDVVCSGVNVFGLCQNSVVLQDFFMTQGSSTVVYSQPIRVCCECGLVPT